MRTKLHFRDYNPKQMLLFPERLDKDIAENDPVRVVDAVIDGLKLDNFKKLYRERGRSPYHPKMMLKAVIYGYMNNLYSCRKIEEALKRDIHFIWLAGYEQPDFNTINRFRNRVKDEINRVFTQLVLALAERGFITLDVEYIDGTKIESKANKYTFVWRKSTERHRARLIEKINALLLQIDEQIAQDNTQEDNRQTFTAAELKNLADELNGSLEKEAAPATKEDKERRRERKKQIKQLEEHAAKLSEYDKKLRTLGDRNSYSKTDTDATFMRMKEDAMRNGQTKPGYNLQISSENQFITDFALFPNPTDTLTMIPFFNSFLNRYGHLPSIAVADSGYGSEENYRFMEEAGMDAYVKYNRFHIEHRPRYTPNPFHSDNFYYNEKDDYFVCPMGQHMTRAGIRHSRTDSGYVSENVRYRAQRCEGCPLRCLCYKARGDRRTIEVNHRLRKYKEKASELLTSEEGLKHRGRRCIEPEAVFGQMKHGMAYKRFRHFGKDKVSWTLPSSP
jgi:transposase